jgi:1,4-alpha-glucan branching enzyme
VVALPFDFFGRGWYEGWTFFEAMAKAAVSSGTVALLTPSEYLIKHNLTDFQRVTPEWTSMGSGGYADDYLDSSNDWMYRHLLRAVDRMTEVAERFADETGVRERVLNQAARELLIATDSAWARWMAQSEPPQPRDLQLSSDKKVRLCLRNFTTLYESLGSGQLSTRFLTELENTDNVFPEINYRSFRKKRRVRND